MPNSAPPKVNHSRIETSPAVTITTRTESKDNVASNERSSSQQEESSNDADIHFGRELDEDTIISVGSDTPRVTKKNRKSVVRILSAHKEVNVEGEQISAARTKRLAKTKKKIESIISEDANNADDVKENKTEADATAALAAEADKKLKAEQAAKEWQEVQRSRLNPTVFEQRLREDESRKRAKADEAAKQTRKPRRRKKVARPDRTKSFEALGLNESANSSVDAVDVTSRRPVCRRSCLSGPCKVPRKYRRPKRCQRQRAPQKN